MNNQYQSFLQSLTDDEFFTHISDLSQRDDSNSQDIDNFNKSILSSISDPFDDSFNEWLLNRKRSQDIEGGKNINNVNDVPKDVPNDDISKTNTKTGEIIDPKKSIASVPELVNLEYGESEAETDEDVVGPIHGFGEYGLYFDNKHKKQQQKDQQYRDWDELRRQIQNDDVYKEPIFKDCIIFVNGHTVPSMNEIHRLVIIHGGKFLSYLANKSAATHIICDRLTPRKQQQYKNCKVVKASWISESVEAKSLLDWKKYRLFKEIAYDQNRLELKSGGKPGEYKPGEIEFANHQFYMDEIDEIDEEQTLMREDSFSEHDPTDEEEQPLIVDLKQGRVDEKGDVLSNSTALDAKHPDFLSHFFAKSRLHHLSMWKADLKLSFLKRILNSKPTKESPSKPNTILHVDFDCFFVSASCQTTKYDIQTQPLAVSHGNNTSDIASCNYVAREFGVKNGMWVGSAKRLCPNLIILDYDFDLYEKYASELYNYLIEKSLEIDIIYPVSIDEALLDMSNYNGDIDEFCNTMRRDIFQLTKCTISIGVSKNILLAKLALRHAKPNGYFHLYQDIDKFLSNVPIQNLPGVGRSIADKIQQELKITSPTIGTLLPIAKTRLINVFGPKTGEKLYEYCRGNDDSILNLESVIRKSVSVDVNFGIRFDTSQQVELFMSRFAKEISNRLIKLNFVGSSLTLKLAKRSPNAPVVPPKFMGMGRCDFFNKTAKLGIATNDTGIIAAELKALTRSLGIPPNELRGVAVTVSKLEDVDQFQKSRQSKLPTGTLKRTGISEKRTIDVSDFKEPIDGNIDWEIFESLPWEIRRELKQELSRRGLVNPTSPQKGKAYLQQLLPTSTTQEPKYMRIIESPKRKRSRTNSPQKQDPVKPRPIASDDLSYDTSVLNDLPSSLREEVMNELDDYKRRKVEPQTLKEKFIQAVEHKKLANQPITNVWLNNQPKVNSSSLFLNKHYYYSDMTEMLKGWIRMSLDQDGPHPDDMRAYFEYFKTLLKDNNKPRCIRLMDLIRREINYHHRILSVSESSKYEMALTEWEQSLVSLSKLVMGEGKVGPS